MEVIGIKFMDDDASTRIAYRKNGSVYVRKGTDGFSVGSPLHGASEHLFTRFGYRRVENGPVFRDSSEIKENVHRFGIGRGGTAVYS